MYRLAQVLQGYQPVYHSHDAIILWRRGRLYRASPDLARIDPLCALPGRFGVLGKLAPRLIARILRFGVRSAVLLDDDTLIVAQRSEIFRVSLSTGELHKELEIPGARRLLNLSRITDAETGRSALCFGEYFYNSGSEVSVWRRPAEKNGKWSIASTFPAQSIDHVHNICQTRDGAIYVLTGDFDQAAAIWSSNFALDRLDPVFLGKQSYRACWLWQAPDGVSYYATDSQFEPNKVMAFRKGDPEPLPLADIAGSSIYGATTPERAFFSSSVEPGAVSGKLIPDMLERKPGPGIAGNDAAIYCLEDGVVTEVLRARSDGWPLRLAQFPTFMFPGGTMPSGRLVAYGTAVKRYDGACLLFERAA